MWAGSVLRRKVGTQPLIKSRVKASEQCLGLWTGDSDRWSCGLT
jgi:hypothetical protein